MRIMLLLSEDLSKLKVFLARLNNVVGMSGVSFALLEYKMLLQDWNGSKLDLALT